MAEWVGDGLLAGYDSVEHAMKSDRYHLVDLGDPVRLLDVNASTRLGWDLKDASGGILPRDIYPNRLSVEAVIDISAEDIAEAGGACTLSMYITTQAVMDQIYPPDSGQTPTPFDVYQNHFAVYQATGYVTTPDNYIFNILGPTPALLQQGTKYWVLVVPTKYTPGGPPTFWRNVPLNGVLGDWQQYARGMSVWTNRRPSKPVITAPSSGVELSPGETVPFTFAPSDADSQTPDDPDRVNRDLAGVRVQYAPLPTPDNPNPEWVDLLYFSATGQPRTAKYVRGDAEWAQPEQGWLMIDNLGFDLKGGGAGDITDILASVPNTALLPSGTWQVRCLTYDWGHPYPDAAAPLGAFLSPSLTYNYDSYSAANTSPWSDPIIVNVPAQVLPPVPVYPTDNIAVMEGSTTRLSWKYRNTHRPAFPQAYRTVQIRKVGDSDWTTIFAGPSSNQYVDLPTVLDNPTPYPPAEYVDSPGFETGVTNGFIATDDFSTADGSEVAVAVNDPANAHTGDWSLVLDYAGSGFVALQKTVDLDPMHDTFDISGWYWPKPEITDEFFAFMSITWLDASDVPIDSAILDSWDYMEQGVPSWYVHLSAEGIHPPPGAVKANWKFNTIGPAPGPYGEARLDDLSFVGSRSSNAEDFTMEATNQYEWRVQTEDTDGEVGNYNDPAVTRSRFWVVSALSSGPLRPLPPDTIDGATLGCGTHRAFVYRRGGKVRLGELAGITYLDWSRLRDDISTSKITLRDWGVDCGAMLKRLEPWAYEVVIFRDNGFGVERVWEGPITLLTYEKGEVTIQAKDVMGYAYRRVIKQVMNDKSNPTTVVDRARRVLQNAFAPDDPNVLPYLTVLPQEDDRMQYRSIPAWARTAFEEVDDMASNFGLDYTTVGRRIMLWGTRHQIGTLPEFRDEDLGSSPIVSVYGMSAANVYGVSDGNGVYGVATRLDVSGNDPVYGLIEMLSSSWASDSDNETGSYSGAEQTLRDSFSGYAESSISHRYPPPVVVRVPDNTTLNPGAVISIQHLVPGVAIPLRSTGTLRTVRATQKLDSVKVVEQGGRETISVVMSPFTAADDSTGEETGE